VSFLIACHSFESGCELVRASSETYADLTATSPTFMISLKQILSNLGQNEQPKKKKSNCDNIVAITEPALNL